LPLLILVLLLQIACVVHCVRGGRNGLWIMVILFFPVLGSLAYAWFEILPGYAGRREVRRVKQAAARLIDPDREVRAAREAVETADTVANRIALADALADRGQWSQAVAEYEIADGRASTPDRPLRFRLARALFEAGRDARARRVLESLPPSGSPSEKDRTELLRARLLEQEGEAEQALAIYADVGTRLPGAEAQCRQAALLLKRGRKSSALPVLIEVERRMKRLDPIERSRDSDKYDWAMRSLAELRVGSV
jgi:hypothetical protein